MTDTAAASPASHASPEPPKRPDTLRHMVSTLQRALDHDRGARSQLRRASPGDPPPAFFLLTVPILDANAPQAGPARDRLERQWTGIAALLAEGLDLAGPTRLGEALAKAKVAELRILRLLQAHDDALFYQLRALVHQLVSKGQPFDTCDLARIILSDRRSNEDSVRRDVARDFYRHFES